MRIEPGPFPLKKSIYCCLRLLHGSLGTRHERHTGRGSGAVYCCLAHWASAATASAIAIEAAGIGGRVVHISRLCYPSMQ